MIWNRFLEVQKAGIAYNKMPDLACDKFKVADSNGSRQLSLIDKLLESLRLGEGICLIGWSWVFLAFYVGLMIALVLSATGKYPMQMNRYRLGRLWAAFLAFAFAATTASGATFVGFPE